jgi:hypothetical protein
VFEKKFRPLREKFEQAHLRVRDFVRRGVRGLHLLPDYSSDDASLIIPKSSHPWWSFIKIPISRLQIRREDLATTKRYIISVIKTSKRAYSVYYNRETKQHPLINVLERSGSVYEDINQKFPIDSPNLDGRTSIDINEILFIAV